ncbi:MAG: hypothetical protein ACRD30_08465, partial [Bryobacteraceae bacterium]
MLVFLLLLLGLVLHAQPPAIRQNGVINAASRIPSALTGASIARRSRFAIEGVRLGSAPAGIRILLQHRERTIVLLPLSVRPMRIEAWMPFLTPLGQASLSIETSQGTSKTFSIEVVRAQPGLFSVNGKGWGPGAIENIRGDGRSAPNRVNAPARPGEMVEMSGTGFGSARNIEIAIGNRIAAVAGSHPGGKGRADSIRFRVPRDSPQGCYVPIYVRVAGGLPSNVVTISIGGANSRCEMPANWPWPIGRGIKLGIAGISRSTMLPGSSQPVVTTDEAFAAFSERGDSTDANRLLLLPPAGTCTVYATELYSAGFDDLRSVPAALASLGEARALDAGPQFTISGSGGMRTARRARVYWAQLGSENPATRRTLPLFLNDSQYRLSVPGGPDIPAFSARLPGIPAFEWANRDALAIVDRSRGATFEWRGVPKDAMVLILAASFDPVSTAGGIVYCAARADPRHFSIPAEILALLPATGREAGPVR